MRPATARTLLLLLPWAILPRAAAQTTLHEIAGRNAGERSGTSVAMLADLDGDGFPEFAIGAPGDATHGIEAGRVDVFDGRSGAVRTTWFGDGPDARFGSVVARVRDLDRDGVDDVLVGAPGTRGQGYVRAYSGRDGSALRTYAREIGFPGSALADLGDLDGDGVGDFAVGTPFATFSPGVLRGKVSVVSGAFGAVLWEARARDGLDRFASAFAVLADLDGDGVPELAVGAPATTAAGYVQVHSGRDGRRLYVLDGAPGSAFGEALARIGDVSGDGVPDLAVGARFDEGPVIGGGAIHLHASSDGAHVATLHGRDTLEFLGERLTSCGDLDGDGVDDLLAAAPEWRLRTGRVLGYAMGRIGTIVLERSGPGHGARFGAALGCADANRDGTPDVLAGAPRASNDTGATVLLTPLDLELRTLSPARTTFRGGDRLTLTGRAFSGAAAVRIDGRPASASLVDGETLDVQVPRLERAGVLADVVVEQHGRHAALPGALRVTPFHELHGVPRPGGRIELGLQATSGDLVFVFGGAPPRSNTAIPGFAGILAIDPFVPLALAFLSGGDEVRFPFDLPNDPTHVGVVLSTQALAGPGFAVFETAFSNALDWSIVP